MNAIDIEHVAGDADDKLAKEVAAWRAEIDKLADDIAVSAATADAAMHELLTRIRRFDELRGWSKQGAKTCAHWLSWRIGDGIGAAREKVHVARALGTLPLVDEALSQGKVSYSKVRAITRVAKPEIEARILLYAEHSTGAQLEKICRGFRQVERICESGRKPLPDDERYIRRRSIANGMVRIEAQLTADEADLVFRALEEARRKARKEAEKAKPDEESSTAKEAEQADQQESVGKEPEQETETTLADGFVLMAESLLATGPRARSGGARNQIFVHLSQEIMEGVPAETPWRAQLADGNWLSGPALLRLACDSGIVFAKTALDGSVLDVGRKLRTVSPALLRALWIRDGGCRFPGCTHRGFVDAHHVEHWAHGGDTSLENTCLLCSMHHHLVHEGGFRIDRHFDGTLMFLQPDGESIEDVPPPFAPCRSSKIFHPRINFPKWDGRPLNFPDAVQGLVNLAGLNDLRR